jgi:pimeloyl-ACP methyl ester carboxylesterase
MSRTPLRPPPLSGLALEHIAPPFEFASLVGGAALLALVPQGDGHPVLVLPGFIANDHSMAVLRSVLFGKGYAPAAWGLGTNVGPWPRVIDGMNRRLDDLYRAHGRKVSIVGWSLGGMYARELARIHPEKVRSVITLASPYRIRDGDTNHASPWYDVLGPRTNDLLESTLLEEHRDPLLVPSTSIYSRWDGVVRWHACIDEEGPFRENIEVVGTHSGLPLNLAAVLATTDRLAQPEDQWAPFDPPRSLRYLFPRARTWRRRPDR